MPYCQNCGALVMGNYCENCGQRLIPILVPFPPPIYPSTPPPSKGKGLIFVAIISSIIIILWILAALSIESDEHVGTPKGSLTSVEDENTPGRYYVTFAGSIKNKDIKITLNDESLDKTEVMNNPEDGEIVQVAGGFNLTYDDVNGNKILDATDQILIQGGEPGDEITIVFKPSGEIIAMITLS